MSRPSRPSDDLPSRRATRSEERREGKECRSRWSPDHEKKKEAKRDTIFSPVLDGKSHPNRQWSMRSDNGMAAVHVIFPVKKMHFFFFTQQTAYEFHS